MLTAGRSRLWILGVAGTVLVLLLVQLAVPAPAAALPIIGDVLPDIPGPSDIARELLTFIMRTFFGIEVDVTRRVIEFLVASPIYTDRSRYPRLGDLRDYVSSGAWGVLTLMFTGSALRYWASGFTSTSSFEALSALIRSVAAAAGLVVYPQAFGYMVISCNYLTEGILNAPGVRPGLTHIFEAALVLNVSVLGIGSLASVGAVIAIVVLSVSKIVLSTILAVLFVSAPLAIVMSPLPETAWLTRTWMQAMLAVCLWPVIWSLCFAVFAVMGDEAFNLHGSFGDKLIKPWVTLAALVTAYKAPQLIARQAMYAGLTPQLGSAAGRALIYGGAINRLGGGGGGGGGAAGGGGGAAAEATTAAETAAVAA